MKPGLHEILLKLEVFLPYLLSIPLLATARNLTHAQCEFQPWDENIAGVYNLSITIVHNDKPDLKINNSLPIYYYLRPDLTLTNVIPSEVLMEDLPRYVTLAGSGFFDWKETVCYFGSQESSDVNFINDTQLECKVSDGSGFSQKLGKLSNRLPSKLRWTTYINIFKTNIGNINLD